MDVFSAKRIVLFCLVLSSIVACTRSINKTSALKISTPKSNKKIGSLASLPGGVKVCYAINVTGSGISSSGRSCGSPLGTSAGFVEGGQNIEVTVPSGSDRTVDLYAYLSPDTSAPCPALTTSCEATINCNTYKVASVSGVSTTAASTTVDMTVDFPGMLQNAVVQESTSGLCNASLKAALTTSGEIVDPALATISGAVHSQAAFTFFKRKDSSNFSVITRSAQASDSNTLLVSPLVRSVSVNPASGQLFGMISDGSLVTISANGSHSEIASGSCPFSSCQLPRWFKTFTLSPSSVVYGVDHGGGVWRVDSDSLVVQVTVLPSYVHQVNME